MVGVEFVSSWASPRAVSASLSASPAVGYGYLRRHRHSSCHYIPLSGAMHFNIFNSLFSLQMERSASDDAGVNRCASNRRACSCNNGSNTLPNLWSPWNAAPYFHLPIVVCQIVYRVEGEW